MKAISLVFGLLFTAFWAFSQSAPEAPLKQGAIGSAIQVYPNPAIDYVNVKFDHLDSDNVRLSLHNIIGNEMEAEQEVLGPHEVRIRLKDFAAGYYLVAVRDEETNFMGTYKFVKK